MLRIKTFPVLVVDVFFECFACVENGDFLRRDVDDFLGVLRVATLACGSVHYLECSETDDLDFFAFHERVMDLREECFDYLSGHFLCDAFYILCNGSDEICFCHC